jgi:spore cortex biosynthesis protein YabQ
METTAPQVYIFLITVYGGLLVGVAYDIYRLVRRAAKRGRWLTVALDVLFIITLGLIVLAVMYIANSGELRLFTFAGLALGFGLYLAGLSVFFRFLIGKIKQRFKAARKKDDHISGNRQDIS